MLRTQRDASSMSSPGAEALLPQAESHAARRKGATVLIFL
jgi:hypothetical protein